MVLADTLRLSNRNCWGCLRNANPNWKTETALRLPIAIHHPAVGRMPDVIAVRSGRVDLELGLPPGIADQLAENPFRRWRAADVAHAYE